MVPLVVVPLVVVPLVVVPVDDDACDAVRAMANLIAYLIESTVFTSTTLLPFLIVTVDWPLENDPPATLISIFFAIIELRTNTGDVDGKVAFRVTSSEVPLTEILAAAYWVFEVEMVVDLVLPLVVVVDDAVVDDAVVDSLEELVALPNGFPLLKRLNPLRCPAWA